VQVDVKVAEDTVKRFEASTVRSLELAQRAGQDAMAGEFQRCTLANFGPTGRYRPFEWEFLRSESYARKVKRPYATLFVDGNLKAAVRVEPTSGTGPARVVAKDSEVPYATVHQYGGGNNIPARPYFPMSLDDEVVPEVADRVQAAAERELAKILS